VRVVLTIAGSDSSAGAGIQADLKAIAACGGYGASAVTAITAQNTRGVAAAEDVSPALIEAQIEAVCTDLPVAAVKTGMLSNARTIESVARMLRRFRPAHFVLDPVMISKSGFALLDPAALEALRAKLFPLATLVTPNRHEARALTGIDVRRPADAEAAGQALLAAGCGAVLVKGGHLDEGGATDVLVTPRGVRAFPAPHLDVRTTHGTGCTYAAAIATFLARDFALPDAVAAAKDYVTEAIRAGLALGGGHGPTDHFFYLRDGNARPWLQRFAIGGERSARPAVGRLQVITEPPHHVRLARAAAAGGADVIQVRDKEATTAALLDIVRAVQAAIATTPARVVVNDRADVAFASGAQGVHVGAHDLDPASARRILGSHRLVGATANRFDEAERRFDAPIDYLGVGPVFGTISKRNPAPALGLDALAAIARRSPVPVIAIGGITPERVTQVMEAGAHGIAVLSGVASSDDPRGATSRYRAALDAWLATNARAKKEEP
jgi:hydroxymethylpyrimidine kinase/phosphomethylpyrimidine kinase/thiamine-phosphate diphosphorylase